MRLKNEARWIERVIRSLHPLCKGIFVFDDNSDDGTPELCESLGCKVYRSPYKTLNETRDKNYLLERIWHEVNPRDRGAESQDWIIAVDGDEELEPNGAAIIRNCIHPERHSLSLRIVYLWDRDDQIRNDGIYGRFTRGSVFRMVSPLHSFRVTDGRSNFHCGSVPREMMNRTYECPARLLHYGYMHKEDRVRKYAWYNEIDPNNRMEDCYRHMVQGDVPEVPPDARLLHAGPLELCALAL